MKSLPLLTGSIWEHVDSAVLAFGGFEGGVESLGVELLEAVEGVVVDVAGDGFGVRFASVGRISVSFLILSRCFISSVCVVASVVVASFGMTFIVSVVIVTSVCLSVVL